MPSTNKSILRAALLIIILSITALRANAQLDAQLSQYFEVPGYYNPAAVGLDDRIRIRAGGRLQWVGIDNAPQAYLATADMPLKIFGKKRLGVGIMIQQDKAGLFSNFTAAAQIAYKLRIFKGELSAGLRIGYASERFRGSEIYLPDDDDYHEGTDEALPDHDVNGSAFDLGLGVWFNHPKFWAGISATHINQPKISFSDDTDTGNADASDTNHSYEFNILRQMYFTAGSNIAIKNTLFEVIPSLMVKTDFTTWRAEATGRVRYKKFISAGIGYRHNDALIFLLGAEFKGFYVGYSYDYPTSAISKASSGSHELFVGYALKLDLSEKNKNKHKSIRIM